MIIDDCFIKLSALFITINLLIILVLLTGCASTQSQIIDKPKVIPSSDIMKLCEEFKEPTEGTLKSFALTIYENKKIYLICKEQNKAKADFIKSYQ